MTNNKKPRYNVTLPKELNSELQRLADEHDMSIVDLIRHFIRLGIIEDHYGPFTYIDPTGKPMLVELYPERQRDEKLQLWRMPDGLLPEGHEDPDK